MCSSLCRTVTNLKPSWLKGNFKQYPHCQFENKIKHIFFLHLLSCPLTSPSLHMLSRGSSYFLREFFPVSSMLCFRRSIEVFACLSYQLLLFLSQFFCHSVITRSLDVLGLDTVIYYIVWYTDSVNETARHDRHVEPKDHISTAFSYLYSSSVICTF